jgi:hypothetical protein
VNTGGRFVHTKERIEHASNERDDSAVAGSADGRGEPACRWSQLGRRGHECDTLYLGFRLTTKACEASRGIVARFTFGKMGEAIGGEPTLYPLDGPEHVGLELSDKDQKTMEIGTAVSFDALGSGEAYLFHARLRETGGTVRGGDFSRGVQVLVDFM